MGTQFNSRGERGGGCSPFAKKISESNPKNGADSAIRFKIAKSNKNHESIVQKQINADSSQVSDSSKP
ncbi:hypothetical protein [Helicobacter sp. 23-1045]